MDDITLTQLFARMDLHLEKLDVQAERIQTQNSLTQQHLGRQDRALQEMAARGLVLMQALQSQSAALAEITAALRLTMAQVIPEFEKGMRHIAMMTAEVLRHQH